MWGGAPAILDMRSGAAAMGAIETAMIDAAYAEVGRSLGLPTHGYLSATTARETTSPRHRASVGQDRKSVV